MEPKRKQRKLINFFIMKNIQLKIAITNLAYMLMVFAIIMFAILSPLYSDIFQFDELCDQYFSSQFFIILMERLYIAIPAMLFLAFIHQILMTHKFCGPMVNFAKTFKQISKGDLTREIRLRRYDFLQTEARQINEMMDGLSNLIAEIKQENNLVLSTLEEIPGGKGARGSPDSTLTQVKKHAYRCQRHLAKLKLSGQLDEARDQ